MAIWNRVNQSLFAPNTSPSDLMAEPMASQALSRALTGIEKGRELALGQARILSDMISRENERHAKAIEELTEKHALVIKVLGEACNHQLPEARPELLSHGQYHRAVVGAATAAPSSKLVLPDQERAVAAARTISRSS